MIITDFNVGDNIYRRGWQYDKFMEVLTTDHEHGVHVMVHEPGIEPWQDVIQAARGEDWTANDWALLAVEAEPAEEVGNLDHMLLHPATASILRFFEHEHLPEPLRSISAQFSKLAHHLAYHERLDGPELTVALRKLLESKDCAVRAAL